MLKLEYIKSFLGFGEGLKSGEYFFSQNMRRVGRSLEPRWRMVKSADSSTVAMSSLGDINWFAEREEGGSNFIYGIDDSGEIFKTQDRLDNWSSVSPVFSVAGRGNGLIVDQTSSQRVLFAQDKHLGSYDGTLWKSDFKDFLWDIDSDPRPMDTFEDWVVIGNSSTVAILNITDDSWDPEGLTFPKGAKVRALKSGKNGILIGVNFQNEGALVLWDAQSTRSIAPWIWLNGKIKSISKYKGVWIVSVGNEFIKTDGYSILKTYKPPDMTVNDFQFGPDYPSGAMTVKDLYLVAGSNNTLTRKRIGIYILDLETELWEFATAHNEFTMDDAFKCLFSSSEQSIYASYEYTEKAFTRKCIGRLSDDGSGSSVEQSFIMSSAFGKKNNNKKTVQAVLLDYGFSNIDQFSIVPNIKISVSIYNFQRQLWAYGQSSSTSTRKAEIYVNGTILAFNHGEVGDQIVVLKGVNAGQTRYIKDISGAGANPETWILDEGFDDYLEQNTLFNLIPFKKVGSKTIDTRDIKNNRYYFPVKNSIQGRNFMVKVLLKGTTTTFRIDGLGLLYDEGNPT